MSAETGHIGASLGAIGVVAAILGAAMAGLGAPWWAWTGFALWGLLWLTAASGLSDPASRKFLAGTLRKSTFTQIYTTLARRNVMGVWNRYCDPAPDNAPAPTLFRAALTWRLYDLALLLAVAYPILLLVGQWLISGAEGRVGSFLVLPKADFWPGRALLPIIVVISLAGILIYRFTAENSQRFKSTIAVLLVVTVVGGGGGIAWAYGETLVIAVVFGLGLTVAFGGGAGFLIIALAGMGAEFYAVAFTGAIAAALATPVAFAIVLTIGLTIWRTLFVIEKRGNPRCARLLLTCLVIFGGLIASETLDWTAITEDRRSLFLFLAVLPLLNALFDVISYAVTLTLIRRGLRSGLPFLWGLADLAVACGLLLGLGATLVAVIHGLNLLAGVPFLDLPALFAGVRAEPAAYVWLYLMLFSTLLPTLLHAFLSLLGVQGIWPRRLRRPVAGWVEAASISPLHAIRASLGLSLIWAMPLLGFGAAFWALWHFGETALLRFLALYLDALVWIAGGAVGAI